VTMPGWVQSAPASVPGWGPSLLGLDVVATLDDLRFSMAGREWAFDDAVIGLHTIEGWWDSAPDATETFAHPTGDGTIDGYLRRGARTVTLRGDVRGKTPRATLEAFARLKRIPRLSRFVVDERVHGLAREVSARVVAVIPERRHALHSAFSITLHVADPLLYSTAVVDLSNGPNALASRGDEAARPVLELVGPHNAVTVQHSAGTLTIGATASGVTRTVDLRTRTVWQGGARVQGALSGPTPVVPPGGASWTLAGKGAGALRARRFEAFS
jgi:hypothetical protein